MNPNITNRINITPLQIAYVIEIIFHKQLCLLRVRSLQLSTVRLLIANGANPHIANNRGETALNITELLQPDQKENFINALIGKYKIFFSLFILRY
jgi:ankyrin repeat protein